MQITYLATCLALLLSPIHGSLFTYNDTSLAGAPKTEESFTRPYRWTPVNTKPVTAEMVLAKDPTVSHFNE